MELAEIVLLIKLSVAILETFAPLLIVSLCSLLNNSLVFLVSDGIYFENLFTVLLAVVEKFRSNFHADK
jgi:hypothetical protein